MGTSEWDELSEWEQLMYLEGLHQEGVLKSATDYDDEPPVSPQRPEFGKPVSQGPKAVDQNRLANRTVTLPSVNWGPPE